MSRSSARRGQVEPLAAIVAVLAVGAGLTFYTSTLDGTIRIQESTHVAGPALERLAGAVSEAGVVDPTSLDDGRAVAVPEGYHLNATLTGPEREWHAGPAPPATADTASQQVSVRLGPGRVRPGRLTVEVWR